MKLPGIGTLILFGLFLNGGSSALADICSFPVITDPAAANAPPAIEITDRGQLFEEADRQDGFADVARTFNPAPVPRITDGPVFGFYEGERLFGLVQDVIVKLKPTADPQTTDGPYILGMDDIDQIVASLDDSVGWYGFFDGLGTFATLTDPRAGGGALAVKINYRGEILGIYDGPIGGPDWLAHAAPSPVPEEPSGWPLLAGSLLAVVMVARRRLRKHTPHVRRRRATRLPAWMRALRPTQ